MISLLGSNDNFLLLIFGILFIMFGIPIILFIIGVSQLKKNRKRAKTILIIATVYLIVGLGICGSMMF